MYIYSGVLTVSEITHVSNMMGEGGECDVDVAVRCWLVKLRECGKLVYQ